MQGVVGQKSSRCCRRRRLAAPSRVSRADIFFPVIEIDAKFELRSVRNCSHAHELSRALQHRKLRSRSGFANLWNVARLRQEHGRKKADAAEKIWKGRFGLRPLQPPEITQNRQSFLWKSLEENRRGLEKLEKKLGHGFISTSLPPSRNAAAPIANWRAIRSVIYILIIGIFIARAAKVRALTKCGCARRARCCCAGREERPMAKRNSPEMAPQRLEKLNPRPEMVWARKPGTHKMWYMGVL